VVLEGESIDRFQELLDGLIAEFQPRSTAETALVETMPIACRRYLRILSFQKVQFDLEIAREASPSPKPVRAALAFRKLSVNSRSLDLLLRYETAFDRQFSRALSTLLKLRAQIPAPPPAEQPELPNEPNFPADPASCPPALAPAPAGPASPLPTEPEAAAALVPSVPDFPNEPDPSPALGFSLRATIVPLSQTPLVKNDIQYGTGR
jgi:hypothetical protein